MIWFIFGFLVGAVVGAVAHWVAGEWKYWIG